MILDLPPAIEQMIIDKAQIQGVQPSELIAELITQHETVNPMIARAARLASEKQSVAQFFKQQPPINAFAGIDAVAWQREQRDEWE